MNESVRRARSIVFMVVGIIFSLSPWGSAAMALALGVFVATVFGNPFQNHTKIYSQKFLAYSIVGLGAGMNLIAVAQAGLSGLGYTVVSISLTLFIGLLLGKLLKSDQETSILISIGTAICGGSAIAAVAPAIRAKPQSVSVALGTVFLLNAAALVLFPIVGHYFELSQRQFGLWSALAIHDTSSVVGAGMQYGSEALQIGTTVKLARALWIVPLTLGIGFMNRQSDDPTSPRVKKPWFILGFLLVAALVTWVPWLREVGGYIDSAAKKGLILTLFLIGSNLTRETLRSVGLRPLLQGIFLWFFVSISALIFFKINSL
jgi:uncharacterized integral membrane protein (TIGR00698 family)